MKLTNGQMSIFDFVFDDPPKVIVTTPPKTAEPITPKAKTNGETNLCPYQIPTIDDIIKQIERTAYPRLSSRRRKYCVYPPRLYRNTCQAV